MRLKFVTENEAPFRMKWMDELAKYMDVSIYHLNQYEPNVNKKYINYKLKRAESINAATVFINKALFKIKVILNGSYDVLLLDGYGFLAQQILILYLYLTRKKFALTIDGGFIPEKEKWVKKVFKSFLITRASFFLSTSRDTDLFLQYYGAKKENIYRHYFSNVNENDIINYSLNLEEKNKIRKSIGLNELKTIIFVGKINKDKGLDILINAIKDININFQCLVIGSSDDNSILERLLKNKRIIYIDFIEKDILDKYYMASDIFVLPTKKDVWGLVIGEAMAKGLPVITTDMCLAGKAMIKNGENGYIVPSEDVLKLRSVIEGVLEKDISNMCEKAIQCIKEYSIEYSAKNDYELFKELKASGVL